MTDINELVDSTITVDEVSPDAPANTEEMTTVAEIDERGVLTHDQEIELSRAFSREVQNNVFTGALGLVDKILPEYIKLDVPMASQRLSNSDYMSKYFEYRFGAISKFLPEEIKAGIVMASYIAANTTIEERVVNDVENSPGSVEEVLESAETVEETNTVVEQDN